MKQEMAFWESAISVSYAEIRRAPGDEFMLSVAYLLNIILVGLHTRNPEVGVRTGCLVKSYDIFQRVRCDNA